MPNICIINQFANTPDLAGHTRQYEIAKYLVQRGQNGMINGLLRFKPAALLIKKYKLSAENEDFLRSNPTFISTFDVI